MVAWSSEPVTHVLNTGLQIELEFGMLVFAEGGKPEDPKKNPRKDENQHQTQPKFSARSGNRTWATVVGGERSHHCAIPAPLWWFFFSKNDSKQRKCDVATLSSHSHQNKAIDQSKCAYYLEYLRNDVGNSATCSTLEQTKDKRNLLLNQSLHWKMPLWVKI